MLPLLLYLFAVTALGAVAVVDVTVVGVVVAFFDDVVASD